MGAFNYTMFKRYAQNSAGMMNVPMPQIPPHWLAYVHVKDVDATAQKAVSLGGQIIRPPFDIPTVGRIAILHDPQGAVLGIFKPGQ